MLSKNANNLILFSPTHFNTISFETLVNTCRNFVEISIVELKHTISSRNLDSADIMVWKGNAPVEATNVIKYRTFRKGSMSQLPEYVLLLNSDYSSFSTWGK